MTKCPHCHKTGTLKPWKGTTEMIGVEVSAVGERCSSCDTKYYDSAEVARQEREAADAIAARGVRTGEEFRFVRKVAGFTATEISELLDVRKETVSRWERGEVEIPRAVAFAVGELYERPRVVKQRLEAFGAVG